MNSKAGTGAKERAEGNQKTSESPPKNNLLPNRPWIPEKQRWTNREALEVLQEYHAKREAKKAAGRLLLMMMMMMMMMMRRRRTTPQLAHSSTHSLYRAFRPRQVSRWPS